MLKCKINPEFNIYNTEQVFEKTQILKFPLGGGAFF